MSLLVFCFLLIAIFILFDTTVFAGEDEVMIVPNSKSMNDKLNEDDDGDDNYLSSKNKIPADLFEEVTEEDTYTYNVDLTNLNLYNLVSLQDADIRCHVRGSIWIGGTLTGSQYVDDGSLDGVSPSNSYVYTNQSSIYFKSRTNQQSQDAYYLLSAQSVIDTTEYWRSILNALPKDSETIKYISPDENGYVDLKCWDYQASGGDNAVTNIPVLYWTDATKIDMGGLAGHLVAPYADIYITYCNHCGSIVGKNITTDGESHLNYWTPVIETEIETEPITEIETETESESETETEFESETESWTESETEEVTESEYESETELVVETETELLTESETELETETETELESETEPVIESESETETESESESEQTTETETETEYETELITESEKITETEIQTEHITELVTEKQTEKQSEKVTEKQNKPSLPASPSKPAQTEKTIEKQTEKVTEKQTETPSGGVLGASRGRENQSETDKTYKLETRKKKKAGVNGVVRETESPGLFQSIGSIFVPKTGDSTPLMKWLAVLGISIIVILILVYAIKNRY